MKKPSFWPENPYPESVWPMQLSDIREVVRDPDMLTAISGSMGRHFWNIASEDIWELVAPELAENEEFKKIIEKCYEFFCCYPFHSNDNVSDVTAVIIDELYRICRAALGED